MTALTMRAALQAERYDLVALRLLYGLLVTLAETAPEAREELISLLAGPDGAADRGRA